VRSCAKFASVLCVLLTLVSTARTDTIHLRNGQTIYADRAEEKNGHVEYDIGEEHFAIPKAAVDRIESGGAPVHSSALPELALTPPREDLAARPRCKTG
jgi:hypothetical protein